jgi:hypothetical protein
MTFRSLVRKLRRAAPAVAAMALIVTATGCSAGCSASVSIGEKKTGGTYRGHGVSFTIPDGWSRLAKTTTGAETGNVIWSEGFSPRSSVDLVGVTAYATKIAITKKNAARNAPKVAAAIRSLLEPTGGRLLGHPRSAAIGEMAGYRLQTTLSGQDGETLHSDVLMIWKGHTEYFVSCQYRANGSRKAEIERGCKTITSSFTAG